MAEVIGLEVATAVASKAIVYAFDTFRRQFKALSDPNFECVKLDRDIFILNKALEIGRHRTDMLPLLEKIDWDMFEASNAIRRYKNLSPRVRFHNIKRLSKDMQQLHERLEEHMEQLDARLGDAFNLFQIRQEVQKTRSSRMKRRVEREFAKELAALERAVERDDKGKALDSYFRLSALVGEDVARSRHLRGKVKDYVKGALEPVAASLKEPWMEPGPEALGMLGIRSVVALDKEHVSFARDPMRPLRRDFTWYTIKMPDERLAPFLEACEKTEAKAPLSPMAPVTVDDFTRRLLLIPRRAQYFAFCFPMENIALETSFSKPKPLEMLLLMGGYMYFDENKEFLRANCFQSSENNNPFVCFNGPHKLSAAAMAKLESEGRFHDVTAQNILLAGGKKFAWVVPNEALPDSDPSLWPHGAFAYVYEDPEMSNFYAVATMADVLEIPPAALRNAARRNLYLQFSGERGASLSNLRQGCCSLQ